MKNFITGSLFPINMRIIKEEGNKSFALNAEEIGQEGLSALSSSIALQITKILSKEECFPKEIAKKLKVHEQNVYYYIRKLEIAGIIRVARQEKINGSYANYYELVSDAYFIRAKDFRETSQIAERQSDWLYPFIDKGNFNTLIIVGSPDPHGPQKARSRDGYFGMDLALFLGSFLNYVPESKVRLDTEVSDQDLKNNNLIIIGGPIVNKITGIINPKLKVRYDTESKSIYSTVTKKHYHSEEIGIIVNERSPFNEDKRILLVSGIRNSGTKAAILSFLKHYSDVKAGNMFNKKINARIVEGLDLDSDGVVDDIEFLE